MIVVFIGEMGQARNRDEDDKTEVEFYVTHENVRYLTLQAKFRHSAAVWKNSCSKDMSSEKRKRILPHHRQSQVWRAHQNVFAIFI